MAIQVEIFQPSWRYYPESTHWTEKPDPGWQCPVEQPESTLIPNLIRNMNRQLAVFVLWAVARYVFLHRIFVHDYLWRSKSCPNQCLSLVTICAVL